LGFWIKAVDWDVERDNGGDSDRDGVDWDDVECVVEDINYSGVLKSGMKSGKSSSPAV
jgi:hypothetical protein